MPTVNHAIPWMYYPEYNKTHEKNEINDVYDGGSEETGEVKNNGLKNTDELHENVNNTNINKGKIDVTDIIQEVKDFFCTRDNDEEIDAFLFGLSNKCFDKVFDKTDVNVHFNKNKRDEAEREYDYEKKISNSKYKTVLKEKNVKQELNSDSTTVVQKREKDRNRKTKWRFHNGMLLTLVILNATGQGFTAEVVSTSSLASLLGYPSTCSLGAEAVPCTLALTCWLRGGTRLRGCGGWLFACCQSEDTRNNVDNNAALDWQYKVSPPRLRQVPQRNVMPNNVFRRRVDDEVTQVECGVPSNRILQKRIIGGREARFAEFPWQAHVRISEFQCGGVLVSQWFVATAAHCVSRAHVRDIVVWLGALDTSAGSRTAKKVGVHQKILHPLFQFRMTQPDRYDIALLRLSRPITFTRHIRAICLPVATMPLWGRSAVIAGWGKTDATDTHTGTNMLRSASVPILSKEQCITWHRSKQISVEIHSEMICAGHSDGHQDACLGDSGGPLIVKDNGRYYLVGITSAGFGCGVDHQPGIYHNVQVTANWIRRVLSMGDSWSDEAHDRNYV